MEDANSPTHYELLPTINRCLTETETLRLRYLLRRVNRAYGHLEYANRELADWLQDHRHHHGDLTR